MEFYILFAYSYRFGFILALSFVEVVLIFILMKQGLAMVAQASL